MKKFQKLTVTLYLQRQRDIGRRIVHFGQFLSRVPANRYGTAVKSQKANSIALSAIGKVSSPSYSIAESEYVYIEGVESLDDYRKGGFHPIDLKDQLRDGRYTIIDKLGYGGFPRHGWRLIATIIKGP